MRAHARISIRCERVQCEHMRMRAFASHANAFLMRHASIRIRCLGVFRVRHARICAHSHEMRAHSHRMRSHSHRMRSHRMRMRAFKGNLCVSGTVLAPLCCLLCDPSHTMLSRWLVTDKIVVTPQGMAHRLPKEELAGVSLSVMIMGPLFISPLWVRKHPDTKCRDSWRASVLYLDSLGYVA